MAENSKKKSNQKDAPIYRLNVSFLSAEKFGTHPILGKDAKRQPNVSPRLEALKDQVLQLLWRNQKHRGLQCYTIAWQTHQSNGLAHLDILLKYEKNIKKTPSSFDYLLDICAQDLCCFSQKQGQKPQINLTHYSLTRLNQAILEYGQKEDPRPLNTFTAELSANFLTLAKIKADPFRYFQLLMREDPYNFELSHYAQRYDLMHEVPGWSAIKSKLADSQAAARALVQQRKPGIQPITRGLIQERLTRQELEIFDRYGCFQTIVDHVNQIPRYGYERPHKTPNLFIYGPKGIGKTSFINQGPTNLAQLVPHYDINLQNRYLNRYYNTVYGFISWNQFKYTDFSPNWVLKLLEGLDLQIPIRYASNVKRDNPLVIATSNMSLTEHIQRRFKDQPKLISMAKSNLLNERIVEVYVPVPMFFMQKLLVSSRS